ncbi:hypothetical protein D3C71_110260 [compost metagenome]
MPQHIKRCVGVRFRQSITCCKQEQSRWQYTPCQNVSFFKMLYVSVENWSSPGKMGYAGLYCFKVGYNNIKQIWKGVSIVALHTIDTPGMEKYQYSSLGCAHT